MEIEVLELLGKLQRFTNKKLATFNQIEDQLAMIYDDHGELVGEVQTNKGLVTRIGLYDAELIDQGKMLHSQSAMIDAVMRPETNKIHSNQQIIFEQAHAFIQAFDDRVLLLDVIIDFDSNYLAIFEEIDERYGIVLPNTGAHISLSKDGMVNSATFFRESYTVEYPESIISKNKAAEIIKKEQLMELTIDTESTAWQYTYGVNHNVIGVGVDGKLITMEDIIDLNENGYEILPKVNPIASITEYAQGNLSEAKVHYDEDEVSRTWYVEHEEDPDEIIQNYTKEQLYEKALCVLNLAVGDAYGDYRLEYTSGLDELLEKAPFYIPIEDDEMTEITFRFVYNFHDIYLAWHAVEITFEFIYASISYFKVPYIPYDELKNLRPPLLPLEKANEKARSLVDVELTFERADIENNIFKPVYSLCYPTSSTGGNIQKVDAYTGEVTFVDTGFVK